MIVAIVAAAIFLLLLVFVASSVKIVQPYQRGVVERLGRYHATVDPGLRLIVPFVDKLRYVDMREQVVDVPPQEVITSDNVVVSVDAVVYYEPTDPQRLIYNVANFILAVTKLAQTNLRNLIGDLQLDHALTSRDAINTSLREILDDATDTWGVRVKRVELQRIDPPADVMSAMHEQMKAERTRRATVTTAEGAREADITRAQGERQAAILRAEAVKQQQILEARGCRDGGARARRSREVPQHRHRRGRGRGDPVGVRGDPRRQPVERPARDQVPRRARQDRRRQGDEDLPPRRHQQRDGLDRGDRRAVPRDRRPTTASDPVTAVNAVLKPPSSTVCVTEPAIRRRSR